MEPVEALKCVIIGLETSIEEMQGKEYSGHHHPFYLLWAKVASWSEHRWTRVKKEFTSAIEFPCVSISMVVLQFHRIL